MSPWWLLLIVPASASAGFLISAVLGMGVCQDCKEAMQSRESSIQDMSFRAGLKEGFSKFTEVG